MGTRPNTDDQARIVRDIIALLPDVAKDLSRKPLDCVRREDVSVAQVKVLVHLAQYGPRTMSELAGGLGITLPSATGLVNPLVDMDFVVRDRDEDDKRVVRIRLSPSAQKVADRIMAERRAQVEAALSGLSPQARLHFLEGLERLAAVFRGDISYEAPVSCGASAWHGETADKTTAGTEAAGARRARGGGTGAKGD